jgi:predicted GNAT family N-acyltransferase
MVSYGFIEYASPEYDLFLRLRYKVLRKPLGLDYSEDQIIQEWDQHHIGAFTASGLLIGGMVLQELEPSILKMRQVVVDEDYQGNGIGGSLVVFAEKWAEQNGFHKIILHARSGVVPFYQNLGYLSVGSPFTEVGIPHQAMEKVI